MKLHRVITFCGWALLSSGHLAAAEPTADVRPAMQRGLALIRFAGTNWLKNKTCFACHHQTLPMLAVKEAALAGCATDEAWMESQSAHTDTYFAERIDLMNKGEHVPGGSFTVGYELWAMSLAGRAPDATTEAMVGYLLSIQGAARLNGKEPNAAQQQKGKWVSSCSRVPLQSSKIADGSWLVETHVKAVQPFFENGDPHGKHQFISTSATAWAD